MQFERVSFQEVFPTALYANNKITADVILNEGDDPMAGLEAARNLVREFFFKHNKDVFDQMGIKTIDVNGEKVLEKKPMDAIVKSWYDKAVKEGDQKAIDEFSKEFIIPDAAII